MTDREILRSKSDLVGWRIRIRSLVRQGTPSRLGVYGGMLWDHAADKWAGPKITRSVAGRRRK